MTVHGHDADPAVPEIPGGPDHFTGDDVTKLITWAIGLGGTWVVLTALVDLGPDTGQVAVALAFLVAMSATFAYLPAALRNMDLVK